MMTNIILRGVNPSHDDELVTNLNNNVKPVLTRAINSYREKINPKLSPIEPDQIPSDYFFVDKNFETSQDQIDHTYVYFLSPSGLYEIGTYSGQLLKVKYLIYLMDNDKLMNELPAEYSYYDRVNINQLSYIERSAYPRYTRGGRSLLIVLHQALTRPVIYKESSYFGRFSDDAILVVVKGHLETFKQYYKQKFEEFGLDKSKVQCVKEPQNDKILIYSDHNISIFQNTSDSTSTAQEIELSKDLENGETPPPQRLESAIDAWSQIRTDNPTTIMKMSANDYAKKKVNGNQDLQGRSYEWLHRIAASINHSLSHNPTNLICGTEYANTQHIIYEDYAKRLKRRLRYEDVKVESILDEDERCYSPPKMHYHIVAKRNNQAFLIKAIINTKLIVKPSSYALKLMRILCDKNSLEPESTQATKRRKKNLVYKSFLATSSPMTKIENEENSEDNSASLHSKYPRMDKKTIESVLDLKVNSVREMTRDEMIIFHKLILTISSTFSDVFPDPSQEIPSTVSMCTADTSLFDIPCTLQIYYNSSEESNYLLVELEPKLMGKSFIFDAFPEGTKEGLVMKIDDVFNYMYGDGSLTLLQAFASIKYKAIGDIFSFVPNFSSTFDKPGSVILYGNFGILSGDTFCSIGPNDNIRITAAIEDVQIKLNDHFVIDEISVSLELFTSIELAKNETRYITRRVMAPTLAAASEWKYAEDKEPVIIKFYCGLFDATSNLSSAFFYGSMENFVLPFGGILAQKMELSIQSFSPFDVDVSLYFQFGVSSFFVFVLKGSWNKENGFDVIMEAHEDQKLIVSDLIDFHHVVTRSTERISEPTNPILQHKNTIFTNVVVRFKSIEHVFKENANIKTQPGLSVEADMTFCDKETTTTLRVLISISTEEGVTVRGTIQDYLVGPSLQVDELDLKIHLCDKKKGNRIDDTSSYIQGSSNFILCIPESGAKVDLVLFVFFGRNKYAVASFANNITFHLATISPSLSFLDFSFPLLQFVYSEMELSRDQIMSSWGSNNVPDITVTPKGRSFIGTTHWSLCKSLFGIDISFAFTYIFGEGDQKSSFSLEPLKTANAMAPSSPLKRIGLPKNCEGMQFHITSTPNPKFSIMFDAKFELFGQNGIIQGGFECSENLIKPNSCDIVLSGDVKATNHDGNDTFEGFPLSVSGRGDGISLIEATASAIILPEFGAIEIKGKIHFGDKATAIVAVQLSEEDPAKDAFYLDVEDADLVDVMSLSLNVIGITVSDIPKTGLLEYIIIERMKLFWAPEGISVFGEQVVGFGFASELIFFGANLKAAMLIDERSGLFHLEASIDPISILNGKIALTGSGGKSGPHVSMRLLEGKSEIILDCAMKFLLISTDCYVHLCFPMKINILMNWKILGTSIFFNLEGNLKQETMTVDFSLNSDHKNKMSEAVRLKLKNAAIQMQKDAEDVERECKQAIKCYEKGLHDLEVNLAKCKEEFDKYCTNLDEVINREESEVRKIQRDAKELIDATTNLLKDNIKSFKAKFEEEKDSLEKDLCEMNQSLKEFKQKLNNEESKMDDELLKIRSSFIIDMDNAKKQLENATTDQKNAQASLDEINSQKPHKNSWSKKNCKQRERWRKAVREAKDELDITKKKLEKATKWIEEIEKKKLNDLDAIAQPFKIQEHILNEQISDTKNNIARLQVDMKYLECLDKDLLLLYRAQEKKHELQDQVNHMRDLQKVNESKLRILYNKANLNVNSASSYKSMIEVNYRENLLKAKGKGVSGQKPINNIRPDMRLSLIENAYVTFTADGLPWSLTIDLHSAMPDAIFQGANSWIVKIERRSIGLARTDVSLAFKVPQHKYTTQFKSHIPTQSITDAELYWLPGFYEVILMKDGTHSYSDMGVYEGLLTTFFIPGPETNDKEKTFILLQKSIYSFRRLATSQSICVMTKSLNDMLELCSPKKQLVIAEAEQFGTAPIRDVYNEVITKFETLERSLSPTLLCLINLADRSWWESCMDVANDMNTTDPNHQLERLLEAVDVVEGAIHGRLSEMLVQVTNITRAEPLDTELQSFLSVIQSTIDSIQEQEYRVEDTAETILGQVPDDNSKALMDISEAISKANLQIRYFQLIDLKQNMTSENDLGRAEVLESEAREKLSNLILSKEVEAKTIAERIKITQDKLDSAKVSVEEEKIRLVKDKHECVSALLDMLMAENELKLTIESKKSNLSETTKAVEDAMDVADNARNKRDDSIAKQNLDEAQDKIDAYQISDFANLVTSAANHEQAAADNGKKACAIYEEIMKSACANFLNVSGKAQWKGTEEKLLCEFGVEANFKLSINLLSWKVKINLDLVFSLRLDLSLILQIADHTFAMIWKEIKHKL